MKIPSVRLTTIRPIPTQGSPPPNRVYWLKILRNESAFLILLKTLLCRILVRMNDMRFVKYFYIALYDHFNVLAHAVCELCPLFSP